MKQIINIIFSLLTTFCLQTLHAGESSAIGKNIFSDTLQEDEFLSPDVAFKLHLTPIDSQNTSDSQTISANFTIAPGYYLYKQRIKFVIKDTATGKINQVEMPEGDMKNDPNFGQQEVYHHAFSAIINLSSVNNPVINASYQGCSEKGLCYAPITKMITVNISSNQLSSTSFNGLIPNTGSAFSIADDDKTTTALKSGNLWLIVGGFFLAGLLLSFTPCVLPMIPILSSIIIGSQNRKASQNKQENQVNKYENQANKSSQTNTSNASYQAHPSKLHAFGLSI